MKVSKFFSILLIISAVFALTGCEEIMAAIGGEDIFGEEDNYVESPSVSVLGDVYGVDLHYGESKTFSVSAAVEDGGTLTYQWVRVLSKALPGVPYETVIAGATSSSYTFTADNAEDSFYLFCRVTNTKNGIQKTSESEHIRVSVSNIVRLNGTHINEVTTWNPLYTYYIESESWAVVEKSLTIPAGTVVKLGKNAYLETTGTGTITVLAEEGKTTYFTSYLDMTKGISIPEFAGSAVGPAKGDWAGVYISGTSGSSFKNCEFRYSNAYALKLFKKTTVEGCTFTDNKSVEYTGALTILEDANESVVKNNVFYNNDWPLQVASNYTVDTSNIFHNPDNAEVKNANQAIILEGGKTVAQGKSTYWMITELPYFVATGNWVDARGHLYIGDTSNDVIVKFSDGYYLEIHDTGTLSLGSGSILTCWKDDEHGGDIEGDGSIECNDGDWKGVYFPEVGYNNDINKDETRVFYNDKSEIPSGEESEE